jgi:hypothetical protein
MQELLLLQASDPLMIACDRPVRRLAWNYVDLDVTTLLSFERPPPSGLELAPDAGTPARTLKTP